MEAENLVAETARRILADVADPQSANRAKDDTWKVPAWAALEEAGLTLAWVPDALGGAGAELADGFAVLREAGRSAAALPLAETLLAGWLLAKAGIASPKGFLTCGPARDGERVTVSGDGTVNCSVRAIAFAKGAKHFALLGERQGGGPIVALLDASQAHVGDGTSIGGDPQSWLSFKAARPSAVKDAPAGIDGQALQLMGAAARAMQMAGALEAILELAVRYANERIAFERPIAKFQAVQHNLARLAGETAAAVAAAGSAADTIAHAARFDETVLLEVAAAKIRVGEAAGEGAAIAHQVFGAIGFTQEHTLHRFTRRLWAWRDDFGNESAWAVKLGNLVAAKGADGLWPMLAAR
ncbi:MAG TPA: acyl-CoA dehydrogenase family protein [Hyphomicrobiaceae bacterium]|jgi:acyl-CoA dehydrogenase